MRANAWMGMSLNIQVAAGPVLGGLLVELLDFRGALAANALSFVLSALFLLGLPPLRAPSDGEGGPRLPPSRHGGAQVRLAEPGGFAR